MTAASVRRQCVNELLGFRFQLWMLFEQVHERLGLVDFIQRITLPKSVRRELHLDYGDFVVIDVRPVEEVNDG